MFLEPLAAKVNWPSSVSKYEVKKKSKEFMFLQQKEGLLDELTHRSSLKHNSTRFNQDRVGMAPFLMRPVNRSYELREGRRIEICLRLGCHDLCCSNASADRRLGRSMSMSFCPYCTLKKVESIDHTLLHCPAYSSIRESFFAKANLVISGFHEKSSDKKLSILLGDDPPGRLELPLYYYLFGLFRARAMLGDPTRPGKEVP